MATPLDPCHALNANDCAECDRRYCENCQDERSCAQCLSHEETRTCFALCRFPDENEPGGRGVSSGFLETYWAHRCKRDQARTADGRVVDQSVGNIPPGFCLQHGIDTETGWKQLPTWQQEALPRLISGHPCAIWDFFNLLSDPSLSAVTLEDWWAALLTPYALYVVNPIYYTMVIAAYQKLARANTIMNSITQLLQDNWNNLENVSEQEVKRLAQFPSESSTLSDYVFMARGLDQPLTRQWLTAAASEGELWSRWNLLFYKMAMGIMQCLSPEYQSVVPVFAETSFPQWDIELGKIFEPNYPYAESFLGEWQTVIAAFNRGAADSMDRPVYVPPDVPSAPPECRSG